MIYLFRALPFIRKYRGHKGTPDIIALAQRWRAGSVLLESIVLVHTEKSAGLTIEFRIAWLFASGQELCAKKYGGSGVDHKNKTWQDKENEKKMEAMMKYIIFEDFAGQPAPFLFPDKVAHSDMRDQLPYAGVLSAGYVSLVDGRFVCSGGDMGLQVSARAADAECIAAFFTRGSGDDRL